MFNKRLRSLRMASKITQQGMADALGLSLNAYQKYEQAEREPPLATLVRISDILNVSLDYLLCRDAFLASGEESVDESRTNLPKRPM